MNELRNHTFVLVFGIVVILGIIFLLPTDDSVSIDDITGVITVEGKPISF